MAFVVIQHLDPTRESLTTEILSKHTRMRVVEVHDEPQIGVDCVYVIRREVLEHERRELRLSEPDQPRSSRMAVDFFLRSLADAQQERAIAVILSGSGTDGALGAKAVKEAGGLVIVQDPRTADHDGMPRRAIEGGAADLVAPAEKIAEELLSYNRFATVAVPEDQVLDDSAELKRLLGILRKGAKRDFRTYKEATIVRRVRRRAALRRLSTLREYIEHLEKNSDEVDALARDLLINVTRFFRDEGAWNEVAARAITPIVERKDNDDTIRVWVPGCATGEEAYTLGLLIMEELRKAKKSCRLQVFATDIATHALDVARAGRYPQTIEADVPAAMLRRYFVHADEHYRVGKALREAIVFSSQDL